MIKLLSKHELLIDFPPELKKLKECDRETFWAKLTIRRTSQGKHMIRGGREKLKGKESIECKESIVNVVL